jgi:hypothetical protein
MRRRHGSQGSQPEQQDMGATGASGSGNVQPSSTGSSTGATSSSMQDTSYQQTSTQQQTTGSYGQGTAPASQGGYRESPQAGYDTSGESRLSTISRHGGSLSVLAGTLAFLEGLAFVIRTSFYRGLPGYAYRWTLHGWGWTLLILGALLFAAGVSHLLGIKGSRHVAAALAVITAVVAFITIFYSIIWGIIVVAASGFAAHSLLSDRSEERYQAGYGYGAGGEGYQGMRQGDEAMMSQGQRSGSHRMLGAFSSR